jgi:hypothetical protein
MRGELDSNFINLIARVPPLRRTISTVNETFTRGSHNWIEPLLSFETGGVVEEKR